MRFLLAVMAAIAMAFPSLAAAEGPSGQPDKPGLYYEPPDNLCDELGGDPECPPNGRPVDPAKREKPEKPDVIYQPSQQAPAATPEKSQAQPKAYQEMEQDCDDAGWGGAPSCN